ncbi:MAG: glycoside hydrolase family 97 catalytic domain-containing protein [Bacteroidota bacterium]
MLRTLLVFFLIAFTEALIAQVISSPDNRLQLHNDQEKLLEVRLDEKVVLRLQSPTIEMLGVSHQFEILEASAIREVRRAVPPSIHLIDHQLIDHYNSYTISNQTAGWDLEWRVYNDGFAYRFVIREVAKISAEGYGVEPVEGHQLFFPEEESIISHNERTYLRANTGELARKLASTPTLIENEDGSCVWLSEAGLRSYPGLWLQVTDARLNGRWAAPPLEIKDVNDRDERIGDRAPYLAEVAAGQALPWRVFVIEQTASGLLDNQLVHLLSEPAAGNFDWVEPGQVAWDWYNANNLHGVDFEAGFNTETYKYYIDFAAQYDIPYIILDEGWSVSTTNVGQAHPDIDLEELVAYGREKGVRLILWTLWKPFVNNLDALAERYAAWGVAGVKVDFMQRDDQDMVDHYWRMAEVCANNRLLVDFHGSYKPAGLHRTFPNVLTREGVKGLEWYKFGNPDSGVGPHHNCILPFTRMVAGPMDFTPGAMRNAQAVNHAYIFNRPMSLGSRAHQLAMFVVYVSPLQMLADSPSNYLSEEECTDFITQIPTTWERTIPLAGEIGEYVAIARKGVDADSWYIGILNGNVTRELNLSMDFLEAGEYQMEIFRDGPNAERFAEDYQRVNRTISAGETISISLTTGGGWVARLQPVSE